MTINETGQKWFAKRNSTTARTDEDAAMAYKSNGPYPSREAALGGLAQMIGTEVEGWRAMNMDASRDERALARVKADEDDVTEGNVRWHIVEITGNPDAPKADLAVEHMAAGGQLNSTHPGMIPRVHTSPLTNPADQAAALLRIAGGDATAVLKILDNEINTARSLYRDSDEAYHRATRIELFKIIDTEPMEEITIEAITVAQRIDHFIKADQIATEIGRKISDDRRLDLAEVWDFSPNVDRAKLLRALAADLTAFAMAMDAAAGFEALSRTSTKCRNCAEPISLRFAEATSSDWKHVKTNERLCGYHFGEHAVALPNC